MEIETIWWHHHVKQYLIKHIISKFSLRSKHVVITGSLAKTPMSAGEIQHDFYDATTFNMTFCSHSNHGQVGDNHQVHYQTPTNKKGCRIAEPTNRSGQFSLNLFLSHTEASLPNCRAYGQTYFSWQQEKNLWSGTLRNVTLEVLLKCNLSILCLLTINTSVLTQQYTGNTTIYDSMQGFPFSENTVYDKIAY